jgi:hypothetical protein
MATIRRHGTRTVFWNGATVNANDQSNYGATGRAMDQIVIYITTTLGSGATPQFKLQISASAGDTVEGVAVDIDESTLAPAGSAPWYDYSYMNNAFAAGGVPATFNLGGAGSFAIGLPDFVAGYIRLVCTAGTALTVTAGFEAIGA